MFAARDIFAFRSESISRIACRHLRHGAYFMFASTTCRRCAVARTSSRHALKAAEVSFAPTLQEMHRDCWRMVADAPCAAPPQLARVAWRAIPGAQFLARATLRLPRSRSAGTSPTARAAARSSSRRGSPTTRRSMTSRCCCAPASAASSRPTSSCRRARGSARGRMLALPARNSAQFADRRVRRPAGVPPAPRLQVAALAIADDPHLPRLGGPPRRRQRDGDDQLRLTAGVSTVLGPGVICLRPAAVLEVYAAAV